MECARCASTEFTEESDGFLYCKYCQTQFMGFAKEVAEEDETHYVTTRETAHSKKASQATQEVTAKKRQKRTREGHSKWTSIEAYNEIYIAMIEDFFAILKKANCPVPEEQFLKVSMQVWFKYLRVCEIGFDLHGEMNRQVTTAPKSRKLHPSSRHRDNFLLGSSSASQSAEHVPLYSHANYQIKEEDDEEAEGSSTMLKLGPSYSVRSRHRAKQNSNYYTEQHSIMHRDPRLYSVEGPEGKIEGAPFYLRKVVKEEITTDESECESSFVKFVEDVKKGKLRPSELLEQESQGPSQQTEITTEIAPATEDDGNFFSDNFEEDLLDTSNYDNILVDRMPSKTKNLNKVVPLERLKTYKNVASPLVADHITKPKLLAFLFITIRLFNFNIYLSDLIRWAIQGHLRYIDALKALPPSWEIMWIDVASFRDYRFPAYGSLLDLTRSLVLHCDLPLEKFPKPDIVSLVKRYISDLNLPNDLVEVVTRRYGTFLNRQKDETEKKKAKCKSNRNEMSQLLPEFEVIAVIAILLTLRDLFNLLEPASPENYFKMVTLDLDEEYEDDLFCWFDWYNYSRTRLHCIKTMILNLPTAFDNEVQHIEEVINTSDIFFTPSTSSTQTITKKTNFGWRSQALRTKLADSFAKLTEKDEEWALNKEDRPREPLLEPTLNPLTTYSRLAKEKYAHLELVSKQLNSSFRRLTIRPYLQENGATYHPSMVTLSEHEAFLPKNRFTFFEKHTTEPFKHLLELATILTNADLGTYHHLFKEAERTVNNGGGVIKKKKKKYKKRQKEDLIELDSMDLDSIPETSEG